MEYQTLIADNDFEMLTEYPYTIRRIEDGFVPKESLSNGYIQVRLNDATYKKHRLIAEQFIPNPNNLPEVDHINHDGSDNHIENLRWVSSSINNRNRATYNGKDLVEYISYDDVPDDIVEVKAYGTHELRDYYYSVNEDTFYYDTAEALRILPVRYRPNGAPYIWMRDTNNKRVQLMITKFKLINGYHSD